MTFAPNVSRSQARRAAVPALLLTAACSLLACSDDSGDSEPTSVTAPDAGPAARLLIAPPAGSLVSCHHLQLTVVAFDRLGRAVRPPAVTWASSASEFTSVSATGLATAREEPGLLPFHLSRHAEFTVSSGSLTASRAVPVWPRGGMQWFVAVTGDVAAMAVGESRPLMAEEDSGNDIYVRDPVIWESSAPSVASVHPTTGLVNARTPGNATVRAAFVEPAYDNDLAVCPLRTFYGTIAVSVRAPR